VLCEIKVRESVSDWTEEGGAVSNKDEVSLFVYRPDKVGELISAPVDHEGLTWKSDLMENLMHQATEKN